MKTRLTLFLSLVSTLALVTSTYGQGKVQFQNNTTSFPLTYGFGAPVGAPTPAQGVWNATPNTYTYGLYVGASTATTVFQMTLIDTAGNPTQSFAAGSISGGTIAGQGNVGAVNGFAGLVAGTTYNFLVAAWSTADGNSYASALNSNDPNVLLGLSSLGSVVPTATTSSSGPTQLFGTGAGQIGGFALVFPSDIPPELLPEPSTFLLGGLGAAALLIFRRPKK